MTVKNEKMKRKNTEIKGSRHSAPYSEANGAELDAYFAEMESLAEKMGELMTRIKFKNDWKTAQKDCATFWRWMKGEISVQKGCWEIEKHNDLPWGAVDPEQFVEAANNLGYSRHRMWIDGYEEIIVEDHDYDKSDLHRDYLRRPDNEW